MFFFQYSVSYIITSKILTEINYSLVSIDSRLIFKSLNYHQIKLDNLENVVENIAIACIGLKVKIYIIKIKLYVQWESYEFTIPSTIAFVV